MNSRCRAVGSAPISRRCSTYSPARNRRQTRRMRAAMSLPPALRSPISAATPTRGMAVHDSLYLGLFLSAVMAATVLPGASEILMLGLLVQGLDLWLLWLRRHRRQRHRLDLELVARPLRLALCRPPLVPGQPGRAGAGARLVSAAGASLHCCSPGCPASAMRSRSRPASCACPSCLPAHGDHRQGRPLRRGPGRRPRPGHRQVVLAAWVPATVRSTWQATR